MFADVLDHCIFLVQWKDHMKHVAFGVVALLVVTNFWWFKGVAWGIEGPINDHWGLQWRKVCLFNIDLLSILSCPRDRRGTYIMHESVRYGG